MNTRLLVRVQQAWIRFAASHDLDKPDFKCCDMTKELFSSLREFDRVMREEDRSTP